MIIQDLAFRRPQAKAEAGVRYLSRIVLPKDTLLSPKVIVGIIQKMETTIIEEVVEQALNELDARGLDSDCEADDEAECELYV